jgi:hypothetical protein
MTKNIEDIKYPDFTGIDGYILNKVVPIDQKLFGDPIYWTVKEDGENTGVYLDENGELQVRTRNVTKVPDNIRQRFLNLPYANNIKALLKELENIYPESDVMLFGEFMVKGKSPKRIAVRDENSFKAFDIWVSNNGRNPPLLLWELVEEYCNDHNVPVVQLVEINIVNSLEGLLVMRDRLLAKCKENHWEGVVGKVWKTNEHGSFVNIVKEKIDIPKVKQNPQPGDELPVLPDTETSGAIEKVFFAIGEEEFSKPEVAMPQISKLVKEQCKKHNCRSPPNVYNLYRERLMRL